MLESVLELVALEDRVLGSGLVRVAELRIDRTPYRPERAGSSLDPEHDPLLLADVVYADEHALGIPPFARVPSHVAGIQSRPVEVFKNLFSFLFQRSSQEERVAMYVIREHERGRALD